MVPFPILLVDDNLDLSDVLKRAATKSFPEALIIHCQSFTDALQTFDAHPQGYFRLIFLDINLGEHNGLDGLSLLQTWLSNRKIPIIVVSTSENEIEIERAYKLGATSYIQKPMGYRQWINYLTVLRDYWLNTVTLPLY